MMEEKMTNQSKTNGNQFENLLESLNDSDFMNYVVAHISVMDVMFTSMILHIAPDVMMDTEESFARYPHLQEMVIMLNNSEMMEKEIDKRGLNEWYQQFLVYSDFENVGKVLEYSSFMQRYADLMTWRLEGVLTLDRIEEVFNNNIDKEYVGEDCTRTYFDA